MRVATQYAPPLSSPWAPRATPSRRIVAVLSHAEYVLTLTAAASLRVKAAPCKAAWWPWSLTSDLESGIRVTCDVRYANFGLPGFLCSRLRPDVRERQTDRQTDVRQKHRLMPTPIRDGDIITVPRRGLNFVGYRYRNESSTFLIQTPHYQTEDGRRGCDDKDELSIVSILRAAVKMHLSLSRLLNLWPHPPPCPLLRRHFVLALTDLQFESICVTESSR